MTVRAASCARRRATRATRAALLALVLAACTKSRASVDATEAECVSFRNKLFSLLPPDTQATLTKGGMDKPTPKELELCRERMNSDEIACALKATTYDQALACRSATDDRPADVKRTPEECKKYGEKMMQLAQHSQGADAFGPPLPLAIAEGAPRECERWLSKRRYDCVMAVPSSAGILGCPP